METMIEQRLKELYEADLEGRVIVLPAGIGDMCYKVAVSKRYCKKPKRPLVPYIKQFRLSEDNLSRVIFGGEIGKTLFFSLEEAENATKSILEDMQNESEEAAREAHM